MIKLLRVDDRLLHGQVAVSWTAYLGADVLLVANDAAKADPVQQAAFQLAKPPQAMLSVKSIKGSISVINNPKHEGRAIFVVVSSPKDAFEIARACPGVKSVCLGGIRQANGKRQIAPQVFLSEQDMQAATQLNDLGREVFLQSVPTGKRLSFSEIREDFFKQQR